MEQKISIYEYYTTEELLEWMEGLLHCIDYETRKCEEIYECWTKSDFNRWWGKEQGIWDRFTLRLQPLIIKLQRITKALETKN